MIDYTLAEDKFFTKYPWRTIRVIMPTQNGKAPVFTPPHFANTIEILLTSDIEGNITINENTESFKEKSAYYIPPGAIHSMKYKKGGQFIICFQISLEKIIKYIDLEKILLMDSFSIFSTAYECCNFDLLYENVIKIQSDVSFSDKITALLTLFKCFRLKNDISVTTPDSNMKKIVGYIENNYGKKITLETVASEFGYHKNYFCAIFKKTMGIPFAKYLNNVRISHACNFLPYTSISETYEKCGFSNESYFIRTFKATVGLTPSQYVKQINQ